MVIKGGGAGPQPRTPRLPSHTDRTNVIADLRLVLDVEVQPGHQTHSKSSAPRLWDLLAKLHEGELSQNGEFASIELAQIADALADPRVTDLLESSAYHEAVFQGRV
jgi:hypothetical protein